MTKAAIYCRISRDTEHTTLGVDRQQDECAAMCESLGWDVVEVLIDNDISASKRLHRPGYRRLFDLMADGSIDAVVAWHPDRITRHPRELEDLIDALERADVKVRTVQSGEYDLATASGRMTARVVGAVARHEAEHKSARMKAKHRQIAAAGGRPGGTRPFGYNVDQTVNEAEAAQIRAGIAELLAGTSIRSIAARWNEAGSRGTRGAPWSPHTVKRVLSTPLIAGEHHDREGHVLGPAVWPAIVDEVTVARVRALLTGRRRPPLSSKYLLSGGLVVCGLCSAVLVSRPNAEKQRGYVSASGPGFHGCGRIRSKADPLEQYVVDALLNAAANNELPGQGASADRAGRIVGELSDLEVRKNDLATDYYVNRTVDAGQFRTASDRFTDRIVALRDELAAVERDRIRASRRDAATLPERWGSLGFEERHAELRSYIDRIETGPTVRGNNKFQPERFVISWAS